MRRVQRGWDQGMVRAHRISQPPHRHWRGWLLGVLGENTFFSFLLFPFLLLLAIQALEPSARNRIVTLAVHEELLDALERLVLAERRANFFVTKIAVVLHLFARVLHLDDAQGCRGTLEEMPERRELGQRRLGAGWSEIRHTAVGAREKRGVQNTYMASSISLNVSSAWSK